MRPVLTLLVFACQPAPPPGGPAGSTDSAEAPPECPPVRFVRTDAFEKESLPTWDPGDRIAPGVAIGDLNGDGWPDLLMAYGAGSPLYLNDGAGRFVPGPTDLLDGGPLPGAGAVALADLDGDGDLDAYLGRRDGSDLLLYNQGDLKFEAIELEDSHYRPWTGSFGDLDNDGDLDLFIGTFDGEFLPDNIIAGQIEGDGMSVHLQDDQGRFHKRYDAVPADSLPSLTLQPTLLDADQDGDLDVYVANDFGPYVVPNHLLINDGTGRFTRKTDCDCEIPMYAMGAGAGDSNGDGLPDLYISNVGRPVLLNGQGDGTFYDASLASGAGIPPTSSNMTSWGTAFADLTLDGCEDMVIVYGRLTDEFDITSLETTEGDWVDGDVQNAVLLAGDCEGGFVRHDEAGFTEPGRSRAVAVGDLNRDGRPDLVTAGKHFLHTWLSTGGCPAVTVTLDGGPGDPQGHGATVIARRGDHKQTRWMLPATTASSSQHLLFFYGADGFDQIEVLWLGGGSTTEVDIPPGASLTLRR
jgi:hypothetical protein